MADESASGIDRVAEVWGDAAEWKVSGPPRGWLDLPLLRDEVRRRQTGRADVDWPEALVDRLGLRRDGRWLSLGCGSALLEIDCAARGLFAGLDAMDISEHALEVARRTAAARGVTAIRFAAGGIDPPRLPAAAYDVALFNMSLHHVGELASALDAVHAALAPGGRLFVNEYVGPSQFQFGETQLALVRALLDAIPERLRIDLTTKKLKTAYARQPVEHWWNADPSEAIRSDEILAALAERFDVIFRRDYGGSLLALALEHIVHNFRADDPEAVTALRLAALLDEVACGHGVLPSDFVLLALARKGEGGKTLKDVADARLDAAALHERDRALRIAAQRDEELRRLTGEVAHLRAERDALQAAHDTVLASHDAILASLGWRALEAIRGLVGRRWGGGRERG